MNINIDWVVNESFFTVIDTVLSCISMLLVVLGVVVAGIEIKRINVSIHANTYKDILDILQNKETRKARKFVFDKLENIQFCKWSKDDKDMASEVCHTYDSVGQIVKHEFIPKKYIIDSWGVSIQRSWNLLQPYVIQIRQDNKTDELWDDFEWLAKEAKKFRPYYGK